MNWYTVEFSLKKLDDKGNEVFKDLGMIKFLYNKECPFSVEKFAFMRCRPDQLDANILKVFKHD